MSQLTRTMNLQFQRRSTMVAAAALTALAMTGCSTSTGSTGASDSSSSGKTLVYWSMWKDGEPQQKVLASAIEKFTASSGIKVDVQWQGRDVLKKLLPTLTSGSVPDLVDQEAAPVESSFVSLGQARDLKDAYDQAIPGEKGATIGSVIPEAYRKLMTSPDGKLFMVPYELISSALWYNDASLPQLVTTPPNKNWQAFTEFLGQQKAAGKAPIAEDGDISFYNSYWTIWGLIRALGPGNVNAMVADKTGAAWDRPQVLDVGKKIQGIVKAGYFIPGYDGSKYPAVQQKWANGAADLLFVGTWAPSETAPYQKPGFKINSFQFPNFGGEAPGDGSVETGMLGFAVPTKAQHYNEAKQFMAFFLQKSELNGIATTAMNLTPRKDVPVPDTLKTVQAAIIAAKQVHRPYDGVDADFPNYTTSVFEPINNQLLFGKITAEQWQQQLMAKTIDYWKQSR